MVERLKVPTEFQGFVKEALRDSNMSAEANQLLPKIIEALKKEFNPTRLFLYGSRANGTARAESDYDFVVVIPEFDSRTRYDVMSRLSSKFWQELDIEVQVWVYSEADFNDWKDEFSSIPETALNTGIEINLG